MKVVHQWWNVIDAGKLAYLEKSLSPCNIFHHKSHMDWSAIEPKSPE
jgi:hypothetical protein